jgi:hypothetical protein
MQQDGASPIFLLVNLVLRICGVYYCSDKAVNLNRNSSRWGLFGFLSPIVAMIWISNINPIISWEENAPLDSNISENENETKSEIVIEKTNETKVTISEPPKYVKSNEPYTDQKSLNVASNKSIKKNTSQNNQQDFYEQKRPVLKKIDKSSDRY